MSIEEDKMKTFTFYKEGRLWYIDLPEWTGDKKDLLMVAGADKLMDKLSNGGRTVSLTISEDDPLESGFDKMKKIMNTPPFGGAMYSTKYWPIWLCKVTAFIFNGKMPEVLYYKVDN